MSLCFILKRDSSEDGATKNIVEEQLPAIARSIRLGEISVDNIDVFCEKGVFELENSKRILEAGREMGLRMNFHADEIFPLGGAEVSSCSMFIHCILYSTFCILYFMHTKILHMYQRKPSTSVV